MGQDSIGAEREETWETVGAEGCFSFLLHVLQFDRIETTDRGFDFSSAVENDLAAHSAFIWFAVSCTNEVNNVMTVRRFVGY